MSKVNLETIVAAQQTIKGVVKETPLQFVASFSDRYNANIYFKREDLQVVRSYKLRGAYNKIKIYLLLICIMESFVRLLEIMLRVWLLHVIN